MSLPSVRLARSIECNGPASAWRSPERTSARGGWAIANGSRADGPKDGPLVSAKGFQATRLASRYLSACVRLDPPPPLPPPPPSERNINQRAAALPGAPGCWLPVFVWEAKGEGHRKLFSAAAKKKQEQKQKMTGKEKETRGVAEFSAPLAPAAAAANLLEREVKAFRLAH